MFGLDYWYVFPFAILVAAIANKDAGWQALVPLDELRAALETERVLSK